MKTEILVDGLLVWDFDIDENGCAVICTLEEEELQNAQVASFLPLDSTPQLPGKGPDWIGFLTQEISFGELDSQIRENINNVGQGENYTPFYSIEDDKLKTTIGKVTT